MTKIKNTKKGMAKKTLSVSLAVAMLATSNVPVWAAEFSDGSEAAFTSEVEAPVVEAEAPVVEDIDNDVETASATQTITANVKLPSSVIWGTDLATTSTSSITYVKNGVVTDLQDFYYIWRDADTHTAINDSASGHVTNGTLPTLTTDVSMAGKKVELYLYRENDDYAFTAVTNATTIDAQNISNYVFSWDNELDDVVYDGKTSYKIKPVSAGIPNQGSTWKVIDDFNVDISYDREDDDFINAGTVTVTATAKGPAYTGSIVGSYEIKKADKVTSTNVETKFKDGLSFAYTGNPIKLQDMENNKSFVTAKDKNTNADMTSEILKVNAWGTNVGDYNGKVLFDTELLKNYEANTDDSLGLLTENTFAITQRDLASDTVMTASPLQYNNGTSFTATDVLNVIKFTDKAGNTLNLNNDVEVVLSNDIANVGTYSVTVKAKKNGSYENTKGQQNVTVSVEQNAIRQYALGTATENNNHLLTTVKEFTNEAVTLEKKDLGDLWIMGRTGEGEKISDNCWDIKGYENNVHAGKATVLIELKNNSGYDGKVLKVYFTIKNATVTADTVTASEKVVYDRDITKAEEYKPSITVKAKNAAKPVKEFTLTEGTDYTVSYKFTSGKADQATEAKNEIGNYVQTTIKITNEDFGKDNVIRVYSKIAYKSLTQTSHIKNKLSTLKNQYFNPQNNNQAALCPYSNASCMYFGSL